MSTLKTGALRGTSGTADTMTLHASDGSVEIPKLKVGSDAAGDVLYHNGTNYVRVAKGTDGQVLTLSGGVPTWASGGITVADQWRVNSNFDTASLDPVSSNWERVDHASQGTIGSTMAVSSGIWTFPSTGVYQVTLVTTYKAAGNVERRYVEALILGTTNNSSYDAIAVSTQGLGGDGTGDNYGNLTASSLVDVTDTSNVKIKFKLTAQDTTTFVGHTENNAFYATFIRLGGT